MRRVPFFSKRHIQSCIKSSNEMFSQRFSPTTGKMEWVVEDNDYDMRNEIARSAYTDMLHDNERNEKYYQATMKAVRRLKDRGKKIHMLDIGTGTGLLAMMAVRSGADGSTACEAFGPIANVAKKIVEKNGFGEKISVIGNRSTDLELKKDGHILSRANLLVTELWDTELIGEGALPTLRDACCRLLEPDFVSVPAAATVYAQVVGSESLWNMHQLDAKQISDDLDVTLPSDMEECGGTAGVFDLHVDELLNNEIHILSAPVPVLRFDFCNNFASEKSDCINRVSIPDTQDKMDSDQTVSQYCAQTSVTQSGVSHCIIMWWTLDMDIDGEITLTTAPRWAHPKGVNRQWRDHWMQAVYFFKRPLCVQEGDTLNIQCCHDDYSIWFDVTKSTKIATTVIDRPLCTCGAHVTWSRHRFAMLNNKQRSQKFRQALKQLVEEGNSRCLCIGDGSLLPVLAATAGFEKVVTLESSVLYQKFLRKLIDLNDLGDQIEIIGREATNLLPQDLPSDQIDVIVGEPFFNSALFPWHNLYFWYAASSIAKIVKPGVQILPGSATLRAMAVEFEDLWKFHAPVNIVQGFDVSLFDELIEGSKLTNEEINNESSHGIALEPHHLWEYPCRALSQETSIMKFDFTSNIPSQKITSVGDIKLTRSGILHGIVLWMDFNLAEKLSVTTGLQQTEKLNGKEWKLPWVRHTKQGVYFMKSSPRIQEESLLKNNTPSVRYSINFEPTTGEIDFDFQLCPS